MILYLLLTMAPFAVVAPLLGPDHRPQPRGPAGHGGGVDAPAGPAVVPGPGRRSAAASCCSPWRSSCSCCPRCTWSPRARSCPWWWRPRSGPAATSWPRPTPASACCRRWPAWWRRSRPSPCSSSWAGPGSCAWTWWCSSSGTVVALRLPVGPVAAAWAGRRTPRRRPAASPSRRAAQDGLGRGDAARRPRARAPTRIPRSSWPCRPCRSCGAWWGS